MLYVLEVATLGHKFSFCEGCETVLSCDNCLKLQNGVVEVVRCKDCKHYSCLGSCLLHSEIADAYSYGFDFRMDDNDFCSYGERKKRE